MQPGWGYFLFLWFWRQSRDYRLSGTSRIEATGKRGISFVPFGNKMRRAW
jgi:hypothetical protein